MSRTAQQIIFLLMAITVVCGGISLFFPFLVKLNVHSGDVTLPESYDGHQYRGSLVVLLLMIVNLFVIGKSKWIPVVFSILTVAVVGIIRVSIHSQGGIDHDYDSKTGVGFLLIFLASCAHFILVLSAYLLQWKTAKSKL